MPSSSQFREPLVTDHINAREKLSETLKVNRTTLALSNNATCSNTSDFRQLPSSHKHGVGHQCSVVCPDAWTAISPE